MEKKIKVGEYIKLSNDGGVYDTHSYMRRFGNGFHFGESPKLNIPYRVFEITTINEKPALILEKDGVYVLKWLRKC